MKNIYSVFKNPLLHFLLMPIIVVGASSFFLDFRPTGLCEQLSNLNEIEQKIEALGKHIAALSSQVRTYEIQVQLAQANAQLQAERINLSHYRRSWQYHLASAKGNLHPAAGEALQPYLILMSFALLFNAIAFTWYRSIPFYLRTGSISTGTILALIVIVQWGYVALFAPLWYSRLTGLIMVIAALAGLVYSWVIFITKQFLPWIRKK